MVKVLIVDDSKTVSQYLEFILGNDSEIEIIGNVTDGKQAIDFVKKNKPDIITMDIDMPKMNGIEATRKIMESTPIPIIVVTASRNANDKNISIEALAAGALTVIQKPVGIGHQNEEMKTKKLISLIKTYAQVKVIKRRNGIFNKEASKLNLSFSVKRIKPLIGELCNKKIYSCWNFIGRSFGFGKNIFKDICRFSLPHFCSTTYFSRLS